MLHGHILIADRVCKERMNDIIHSSMQWFQEGIGNNLVPGIIKSRVVKLMHYHANFNSILIHDLFCNLAYTSNAKTIQIQNPNL